MTLDLDRVAVEDAGATPVRLAAAIIKQLPNLTGAVPVYDIARALDIEEIREHPLSSIEGCLVTDKHKSYGAILVNAASNARRRRYTVGHELGHFLNERHVANADDGFHCTKADMVNPARAGQRLRQEREANIFAIELLTPPQLIQPRLSRAADLEHALAIADSLHVSKEAAARRYVSLHGENLAVVFSVNGRIRYVEKGGAFPRTRIWTDDTLPLLAQRSGNCSEITSLDEVNAAIWLSRADGVGLFAQTLYQAEGYAMTLLVAEDETRDAGDSETDRAPWDR